MAEPFTRRIYRSPARLFGDVRAVFSARGQIRDLMRGQTISAAFRERLMLAVSAVNGCRYCSFVHAQQALKAGLSDPEVRALCAGALGGCPEEELPALLYAQH
jgi:AhpD family alkylhydroperoxidase